MAFNSLITSRRFWLAVFGIAQSVVFVYVPSFPKDIWIAVDALVTVLIAALTVDDAVALAAGRHYLTGETLQK
jgi:hypothetical protein